MTSIGLSLSSEQHPPDELVEMAIRAEEVGFDFLFVSDHFHPWLEAQGQSPFVWSTLGAIARETDEIEIGTGVTCPTIRMHPAINAHAAASVARMMDGRFMFGVGTGENLNEHVVGARWPSHNKRLEMLEEAIDVIRSLWTGEQVDHDGKHYTVDTAKIYTLPDDSPPIHVAASGPISAQTAGQIGDGLISTGPDEEVVETFQNEGDGDRPRYGQITGCYAQDKDEAAEIAVENWSNAGLPGELSQELPTPTHFDQASQLIEAEDLRESIALADDPEEYIENIETFADAGFDHVSINNVNPDYEGAFEFFEDEVIPAFS